MGSPVLCRHVHVVLSPEICNGTNAHRLPVRSATDRRVETIASPEEMVTAGQLSLNSTALNRTDAHEAKLGAHATTTSSVHVISDAANQITKT
jgi:hypothetical protein